MDFHLRLSLFKQQTIHYVNDAAFSFISNKSTYADSFLSSKSWYYIQSSRRF